MSSRLNKALSSGELKVINHESTSVAIMIGVTDPETKRIKREVRTLRPKREVILTRHYTLSDLQKSSQLKIAIDTRNIEIVDTWTPTPKEGE
jgi:hypothetical protein